MSPITHETIENYSSNALEDMFGKGRKKKKLNPAKQQFHKTKIKKKKLKVRYTSKFHQIKKGK